MEKNIVIKGAREHNLKGIDVTIPRDQMVVLTGLSGSGKSSLAFDSTLPHLRQIEKPRQRAISVGASLCR